MAAAFKPIITILMSICTIIQAITAIIGSIAEIGNVESGHRENSIRSAAGSDFIWIMNRIRETNKSNGLIRRAAMTEGIEIEIGIETEIETRTEIGSDVLVHLRRAWTPRARKTGFVQLLNRFG
jgi:hypothetical protein